MTARGEEGSMPPHTPTNKGKSLFASFSSEKEESSFLPLLFFAFLIIPRSASAHLASTGLGPAYDGIYHFALTPQQAFPMAALALFAGRRGPTHARLVTLLLPPAWLIACLSGLALPTVAASVLPACALLAAGGLLASDITVPPMVTATLAVLCGAALGVLYGTPTFTLSGAIAAAACVFALLALLASISLPLRRMPAIIAVRVAGSWTAALGLLLVGWFLHGGVE
jgi:urease accessory protein